MPRINVLDRKTAELIAAGEVVERPSSVAKELIENSIDAGATDITIEIKNGGIRYLRITDNGCGIYRDDIAKVFLRHATSKVANEDDLYKIGTLGFRGEAMASIASVSKVELTTRMAEENFGVRATIEGGDDLSCEDAGCSVGTTVIVRDLFYNIPARMKFLKKDSTEGTAIAALVDRLALSHPEISFRFVREGQIKLKTPGDGRLLSAIDAVYGSELFRDMLEVQHKENSVEVTGYVSKPELSRGSRNMQHFFINNRYIRSTTIMAAVEEAYRNFLMKGKYPVCVLNINVPVDTVDVNVHPAKLEVKLSDEKVVFEAVYRATKKALTKLSQGVSIADVAGQGVQKKLSYHEITNKPTTGTQQRFSAQEYRNTVQSTPKRAPQAVQLSDNNAVEMYMKQLHNPPKKQEPIVSMPPKTGADFSRRATNELGRIASVLPVESKEQEVTEQVERVVVTQPVEKIQPPTPQVIVEEKPSIEQIEKPAPVQHTVVTEEEIEPSYLFVGEVFGTYLILQKGDEMLLVDKHAAHERILFEQLKREYSAGDVSVQQLISPVRLTVSKDSYSTITSNLDIYEKMGFEIDDFGEGSVMVRAIPAIIAMEEIETVVAEIYTKLENGNTSTSYEHLDELLHMMACKAAIKGGNFTSELQHKKLIHMLSEDKNIRNCPHGRPVMISMKNREIEKMFGRLG